MQSARSQNSTRRMPNIKQSQVKQNSTTVEKQNFVQKFIETVLEIIEDKPNFLIPMFVYCLLITVYYCQLSGYIFSTFESKPMKEEKVQFLAHINEISPITFLLYMRGNDTLTYIAYFFMNLVMYFYFSYAVFLTFIKMYKKYFHQKHQRVFTVINQFLNIFFTFFWWIFYTPYIEINSAFVVCGDNSFLVEYREESNCNNKPVWHMIMGISGLFFTIVTGLIVIYFFRNYEFHEQNLLKRRYNLLLLLILVIRFFLTFFYYLNLDLVQIFKHISAQFIGISLLYDIVANLPFQNLMISRYYGVATIAYEACMSICAIWIFTDELPDYNLFYLMVIGSTILGGFLIAVLNYRNESILKINPTNFKYHYKHADYYLEEIVRLAYASQRDEKSKFKVFETLIYHKQSCQNDKCYCKIGVFMNEVHEIIVDEVLKLVDSLFRWILQQPQIIKDIYEFEHFSLKYISYLAKYRNNAPKAYFELKILLSKRKEATQYFRVISKILSKTIEKQIEIDFKNRKNRLQNNNSYSQDLNVETLLNLENLTLLYIPQIIEVCNLKIQFWKGLKKGFNTMESCIDFSLKIIRQIQNISNEFNVSISRLSGLETKSVIYFKLLSTFECLVKNETIKTFQLEQSLSELKKRDMSKQQDTLNNINLLDNQIQNFFVSISKSPGLILNPKKLNKAEFFGYSKLDFTNITHIEQLMPPFISKIHNQLMMNFIQRGTSDIIKSSRATYIMKQNQFIQRVQLHIDNSFGYFDDYCAIASVLGINTLDEYVIFNKSGKILGITQGIFKKLFQVENNISLKELQEQSWIFLIFKDILKYIHEIKGELHDQYTGKEQIALPQQKGFVNLNMHFKELFQQFNEFIYEKQDEKNKADSYMKMMSNGGKNNKMQVNKKTRNFKSTMQQIRNAEYNNSFIEKFNMFDDDSQEILAEFFSSYAGKERLESIKTIMKKCRSQKSDSEKGSSDIIQWRLFYKFKIDFDNLVYNYGTKKDTIIIMKLSDIVVQKKKFEDKSEFNRSMLTYINNSTYGLMSQSVALSNALRKNKSVYSQFKPKDGESKKEQPKQESDRQKKDKENNGITNQAKKLITPSDIQVKDSALVIQDNKKFYQFNTQDKFAEEIHIQSPTSDRKKSDTHSFQKQASNMDSVQDEKQDKNYSAYKSLAPGQNNGDSDDDKNLLKSQLSLNMPNEEGQYVKSPSQYLDEKDLNYLIHGENFEKQPSYIKMNTSNKQEQKLANKKLVMKFFGQRIIKFLEPYFGSQHPSLSNQDNQKDLNKLKSSLQDEEEDQKDEEEDLEQEEKEDQVHNLPKTKKVINRDDDIDEMREEEEDDEYAENDYNGQSQNSGLQNGDLVSIEEGEDDFEKVTFKDEDGKSQKSQKSKKMGFSSQSKSRIKMMGKLAKSIKSIRQNKMQNAKSVKQQDQLLLLQGMTKQQRGIQEGSVKSTQSMNNMFGSQFLKEILQNQKIPLSAKHFQLTLILYLIIFLTVSILIVVIIDNKIFHLSSHIKEINIANILHNNFAKGYLGTYSNKLIELGYLNPTYEIQEGSELSRNTQFDQYIEEAFIEFDEVSKKDNEFLILQEEDYFITDPTEPIKMYANDREDSIQLTFIQIIEQIRDSLHILNDEQRENQIEQQLLFFRSNFMVYAKNTANIVDFVENSILQTKDDMITQYMYLNISACIICVFIISILIPSITQVNKYEEKIIMLVARINSSESETEIKKIQLCIDMLQDEKEKWITFDFLNLTTQKISFDNIDENVRTNTLSSKIQESKIQLLSRFWKMILWVIVTIIFFLIIMFIVIQRSQDIQPSLDMNKQAVQANISLSNIYIMTEFVIADKFLKDDFDYYPEFNDQEIRNFLKENVENINQFQQENLQNLYGSSVINQDIIDKLSVLFSSDLCQNIEEYNCKYSGQSSEIYSEGLIGLISQVQKTLIANNEIVFLQNEKNEAQFKNFLNSEEFGLYFLDSFQVANLAIREFINLIIEGNIDVIDGILLLVYLYFVVLGSLIFIIYGFVAWKIWNNLKNNLFSLNFLLTCIPFEKLSEEVTLHMLKTIRNY